MPCCSCHPDQAAVVNVQVLEIVVRRWGSNHYRASVLIGKLTLVDLAGSERAAETNNAGQKLRDGANINKSLLALANCINALGKQQKTGVAYVPYRNSKLTRLLKDSLRGNSRTAMVATISAAADQYHHSVNTLKYADRAKEIKTHVVQNVGSVERHITDYQNIIDNLQTEVQSLKARLADKPPAGDLAGAVDGAAAAASDAGSCLPDDSRAESGAASSGLAVGAGGGALSTGAAVCSNAEAETLAWIDALAQEINENVEERINLQKALFELEDINVCNQYELQHIEDVLKAAPGAEAAANAEEAAEAHERQAVLQEEMQDNTAEANRYRADIAANEACRREIQGKIETAIDANSNVNFLKILSTFRIQVCRRVAARIGARCVATVHLQWANGWVNVEDRQLRCWLCAGAARGCINTHAAESAYKPCTSRRISCMEQLHLLPAVLACGSSLPHPLTSMSVSLQLRKVRGLVADLAAASAAD
eukprot:GHRQ01019812.1.p1 GENE.GHRQ01019812.1~~GHRQ01019812.1.p1  ORF type:complete len:481 (+),score=188.00 GHRQ01019812.1:664-2106(+)